MNDNDFPAWTDQARRLLDESAQGLDAATLSRLNRARQAALARRAPRTLRPWFVPAGLASACALLLAVAVVRHAPAPAPDAQMPVTLQAGGLSASDLDIVASDDGLEFYQDLEFYAWLEAQGQEGNG